MCSSFPREPHFLTDVSINLKESLIPRKLKLKGSSGGLWSHCSLKAGQLHQVAQCLTHLSCQEWRSPIGLSGLLFQGLTTFMVKCFS